MVDRGGIDPMLGSGGGNPGALIDALASAIALLTIQVRGQEARIAELQGLAAHLDHVEGEAEGLREALSQLNGRIDRLVAMLTDTRNHG